jgi:hypothetical protein
MKPIFTSAIFTGLLAGSAVAQPQPTAEDLRTAYEMAIQQRNRSQNEQIDLAVNMRKLHSDYEARLETAMQWLKQAQEAQPK